METHFEGSRGSDHNSSPHQRQYDEQNPDIVNNMDGDKENDDASTSEIDSEVNTDFGNNAKPGESLTDDESAKTDPNNVSDKPSFNRNETL